MGRGRTLVNFSIHILLFIYFYMRQHLGIYLHIVLQGLSLTYNKWVCRISRYRWLSAFHQDACVMLLTRTTAARGCSAEAARRRRRQVARCTRSAVGARGALSPQIRLSARARLAVISAQHLPTYATRSAAAPAHQRAVASSL